MSDHAETCRWPHIEICVLLTGLTLYCAHAHAQSLTDSIYPWVAFEINKTRYQGTPARESADTNGFFIAIDYLDIGGITLGRHRTTIDGELSIDETRSFLSARYHIYSDRLGGKVTPRIDIYRIRDRYVPTPNPFNTETTRDQVNIRTIMASYINYAKTLFVQAAWSTSDYHANNNLLQNISITQFSPAIGAGFNQNYDWINFRFNKISYSNSNRVDDNQADNSFDIRYMHWFQIQKYFPEHAMVNLTRGDSRYIVDHDAAGAYTLPDTRTSSYSIGAQWNIYGNFRVMPVFGRENYQTNFTHDNYSSLYSYINISYTW